MTAINNAQLRLGAESSIVQAHFGLYPPLSYIFIASNIHLFHRHLFEKNRTRIDEDSRVANLGAENRSVPQTPIVAWKLRLLPCRYLQKSTELCLFTSTQGASTSSKRIQCKLVLYKILSYFLFCLRTD